MRLNLLFWLTSFFEQFAERKPGSESVKGANRVSRRMMTWLGNQIILADNGSKSVCLLEGFVDFLSLHKLKKQAPLKTDS
ncbi:hypothetical protein EON73_01105 [bacterium]|nr:MAG: hypothetical protein EON73_01105 [bacterium]